MIDAEFSTQAVIVKLKVSYHDREDGRREGVGRGGSGERREWGEEKGRLLGRGGRGRGGEGKRGEGKRGEGKRGEGKRGGGEEGGGEEGRGEEGGGEEGAALNPIFYSKTVKQSPE